MAIVSYTFSITANSAAGNNTGWVQSQGNNSNPYLVYIYEDGEARSPLPGGSKTAATPSQDLIGVRIWFDDTKIPDTIVLPYAENDSGPARQYFVYENLKNYLTQDATTEPLPKTYDKYFGDAESAEPPPSPGDDGSGSGSGSGTGGGARSPASADPTAALQRFLADHLKLYWDPSMAPRGKSEEAVEAAIPKGGWGPASQSALKMIASKISDSASVSALEISATADKIVKYTSPDEWRGAKANGVSFGPDHAGLLDFLKFAWVASNPDGMDGIGAARQIGFDVIFSQSENFPAAGTPLRALCEMGAVSPAPFVFVKGPGGAIPAGSKIVVTGQEGDPIVFTSNMPGGAVLGVGVQKTDSVDYHGGKLFADIYGDAAITALSDGVTLTLQLPNGRSLATASPVKMGSVVDFSSQETTAPTAAPAQTGAQLSGQSAQQLNTRAGNTERGTTPGFAMQNVYVTGDGNLAVRSPQVTLKKRVPIGRGDVFELRVVNAGDFILVPLSTRGAIKEAVSHWTQMVLAGAPQAAAAQAGASTSAPNQTAAPTGVPHVALKQIEWGYERNFRTYGPGGVSQINLVSYEPADSVPSVPGVNVISVQDANARGQGQAGRDFVEQSIVDYIGSDSNPTGTSIYLSSGLNRAMNSFPVAQYRTS